MKPPVLLHEHIRREEDREWHQQWWFLSPGFVVLVNLSMGRPNAFVNLDDLDVFIPLCELRVIDHFANMGIAVETPHGTGHNCFKFAHNQKMAFLSALRDFFLAHIDEIRGRAKDHPLVKNWRDGWWYRDGIAPAVTGVPKKN
jgi:hypothetical protein